jgi:tetratricopeptide (TPR) repeat protein
MSVRRGFLSLLGLAFITSACAGGAGEGPGSMAQPSIDDDDLPEWVLALPEGEEPRDNDHTAEAALYLFQAQGSSDIARQRELYLQALEAAEEGIEADPTNAQSYFQAGEAYIGLGDYTAADEMFNRAEEIFPRYVLETDFVRELTWIDVFNDGVELLIEGTGDPIPFFEQAHAIYQGRPEAMVQLGSLYAEQGRDDEAVEMFQMAVDVIEGPRRDRVEDPEILAEWDEAREVALFNVGQLRFEAGQFDQAAAAYERLVEVYPDDFSILNNLAASLVSAGETERAEALYDELMARPDLDARDFLMIGIGLSQGGNEEQAARAFSQAHELIPEDREALYNYAQALYFAEMWEELIPVAARLIELDTHNRNAYQIYLTGLVELERQDEASDVVDDFSTLPFHVEGMYMGPLPDGAAVVGRVTNQLEDPGSTVDLRVYFYNLAGQLIGSEDTSVTLGAFEEGVDFQVDMISDEDIAGYRYEIL